MCVPSSSLQVLDFFASLTLHLVLAHFGPQLLIHMQEPHNHIMPNAYNKCLLLYYSW